MWLDLRTAADRLGISEKTLRRLVADRRIRFRQIGKGGSISFKQEFLDEFNTEHTVAPVDAAPPPPGRPPKARRKPPADSAWWDYVDQTASQRGSV
ncbi:MAG TPA: helix-turn-helix domain-containing protein [Pirellulales bacterium]|nr:helix-turn-helix domain-containing protein [Pirellulales bacterium]